MSISPITPTEPEPSWQPLRKQVTFNNVVEYYGGTYHQDQQQPSGNGNGNGSGNGSGVAPAYAKKNDEVGIELGNMPAEDRSREAQERWREEQRKRKRMVCCLSKRTFIIVVVVSVFLLGALLGGVAATLINKKNKGDDRGSSGTGNSTPDLGAFPTKTHVPAPVPTTR